MNMSEYVKKDRGSEIIMIVNYARCIVYDEAHLSYYPSWTRYLCQLINKRWMHRDSEVAERVSI